MITVLKVINIPTLLFRSRHFVQRLFCNEISCRLPRLWIRDAATQSELTGIGSEEPTCQWTWNWTQLITWVSTGTTLWAQRHPSQWMVLDRIPDTVRKSPILHLTETRHRSYTTSILRKQALPKKWFWPPILALNTSQATTLLSLYTYAAATNY